MTFHETPPRDDELDLGPAGTGALEYRIDKLLRENQALAERTLELEIIRHAAVSVVEEWTTGPGETQVSRTFYVLGKLADALDDSRKKTPDLRELLRSAIKLAMGTDPHSGGEPHPDTVDAITDGVLARIAVSNARPAKYADEPWREQTGWYHAKHAIGHSRKARDWFETAIVPWLSDLGQPEAAHAGLRIDFLLWRHGKDAVKE